MAQKQETGVSLREDGRGIDISLVRHKSKFIYTTTFSMTLEDAAALRDEIDRVLGTNPTGGTTNG